MASEKTMRVEEIKKGQQEMQEKIAQMTKTVTNLTKGKWITDDPDFLIPIYKEILHLGKTALILPLSQIRMTLVNKKD